jgi:ABC-type antimicrobial peptide transport system permease subunit
MSKAGFPINDLLRRRLQTSITIITLTLSVASTVFLLLFSSRLGFGTSSAAGTLTQGFTVVFSQFILFIAVLIFAIGAVLTGFLSFLMMAQRTRDFGLIKAAGCPNSLVAGYFMTELLTTTVIGCVLGVIFGFVIDYAIASVVFSSYLFPNFWFAPLVFIVFFILSIGFGLHPILKAAKMSPINALSPISYYGLTAATSQRKPISRSGFTWRVASRSLYRRQSASIRIVFLLSIVFILLTVSIAGGIIAHDTTTSWVQKSVDKDAIAIAHNSMGNQYKLLLSTFSGTKVTGDFDYSDPKLAIPTVVINQLKDISSVSLVDTRLILKEHVKEIANFTIDPETQKTYFVGDNAEADLFIIGVDPIALAGTWHVEGRFLEGNDSLRAVIGDSVAKTMYSSGPHAEAVSANPLVEGMEFQNKTFSIVGVCVDPMNNGLVTYVPIGTLENMTGVLNPNLLLVKLTSSADRQAAIAQIKALMQATDPDLNVFTLDSTIEKNTNFLSSAWQTIMLLPLFTLATAALSLVGYMMLAVDEQHQEFAVLRAVGAKPRRVVFILAIQSILVLLSSFGVGISLGVIITLLILMSQPLVTTITIIVISSWLFSALAAMFLFSLYPAFRVAKTPILKIMT